MIGKKFHRLTVLERVTSNKHQQKRHRCLCDCGKETIVTGSALRGGHTKSCGCLQREITSKHFYTHGQSSSGKKGRGTRTYNSWRAMHNRCCRSDFYKWHLYGGKGIKICDRWLNNFENFFEDMGERPIGMTLDRVESNENYEPGNCRWATPKEQARDLKGRPPKLSKKQAREIRELYIRGFGSMCRIAKIFKVSDATICNVINRKDAYQARGGEMC